MADPRMDLWQQMQKYLPLAIERGFREMKVDEYAGGLSHRVVHDTYTRLYAGSITPEQAKERLNFWEDSLAQEVEGTRWEADAWAKGGDCWLALDIKHIAEAWFRRAVRVGHCNDGGGTLPALTALSDMGLDPWKGVTS